MHPSSFNFAVAIFPRDAAAIYFDLPTRQAASID